MQTSLSLTTEALKETKEDLVLFYKMSGWLSERLIEHFQAILVDPSYRDDELEDFILYENHPYRIDGIENFYRELERVIHEHLSKVRSEIMASTDDNLVQTLCAACLSYFRTMDAIRYTIELVHDDARTLKAREDDMVEFFLLEVWRWPPIYKRFWTVLLDAIYEKRGGVQWGQLGVSCTIECISFMQAMKPGMPETFYMGNVSNDDFEKTFLLRSAEFYGKKSDRFLAGNTEAKYVEYIEQQIDVEIEDVRDLFDDSTVIKSLRYLIEQVRQHKLHLLIVTRGRIKC